MADVVDAKPTTENVEDLGKTEKHITQNGDDSRSLFLDAKQATENEHKLSLVDGFRLYPKAMAWSIFVSSACVMEGNNRLCHPLSSKR